MTLIRSLIYIKITDILYLQRLVQINNISILVSEQNYNIEIAINYKYSCINVLNGKAF